jgi:hypothetical protein
MVAMEERLVHTIRIGGAHKRLFHYVVKLASKYLGSIFSGLSPNSVVVLTLMNF